MIYVSCSVEKPADVVPEGMKALILKDLGYPLSINISEYFPSIFSADKQKHAPTGECFTCEQVSLPQVMSQLENVSTGYLYPTLLFRYFFSFFILNRYAV